MSLNDERAEWIVGIDPERGLVYSPWNAAECGGITAAEPAVTPSVFRERPRDYFFALPRAGVVTYSLIS